MDARRHVKENHHKEQSRNDKISSEVIFVVSVATSAVSSWAMLGVMVTKLSHTDQMLWKVVLGQWLPVYL